MEYKLLPPSAGDFSGSSLHHQRASQLTFPASYFLAFSLPPFAASSMRQRPQLGQGVGFFWFGLGRDPFLQSGKILTSQILVEEKKGAKKNREDDQETRKKMVVFKYKRPYLVVWWDCSGWGS